MAFLTDQFKQNFEEYVLREEGKLKNLVKEFTAILGAHQAPDQRQAIVHELSELFKVNKYLNAQGQRVSIKHEEIDSRIEKFKTEAAKALKGKKQNLKSLILGVYGLETEFKASAYQPILPDDPKVQVDLNDQNRFQNLVSPKNPFVAGIVGSTYSGRQLLEEKDRHMEDSVLVQSFRLRDGTKVTLGGVGDGLSDHTDATESRMASRASKFAIKHGLRSMASVIQNEGPDALAENRLATIFDEVFAETSQKANPGPAMVRTSTTVAVTALVERPDGTNSLHLINLGDCMVMSYNTKRGFVNTYAGGVHRGLGPAGIPGTYDRQHDRPYTRVLTLNPGEVPIILSDGVHDGFEQLYMIKAPLDYFTAERCAALNMTLTDKDFENNGVVIQVNAEQRDVIKQMDSFEQGTQPIIANLNSQQLEERIRNGQKPMNSAQAIAKSIFEISVEATNAERANLADHIRGFGDDASIVVLAPENALPELAAQQPAAKSGLGSKIKSVFGRR